MEEEPEVRMFLRLIPVCLFGIACSDYELQPNGEEEPLPEDDTGTPEQETDVTPEIDPGSVTGRICAPGTEAAWVSGASVWVVTSDGDRVATTTDGEGWFTLDGVPPGTYTVYVEKGSFTTEFMVEIVSGEHLELAHEECLSSEDVTIAVVTGLYDSIEHVIDGLGFEYTLIEGKNGSEHVDLLLSPPELEKYDIIFFNCGMKDTWESSRDQIAQNLADYVHNGGSVYTSDWSYFLAEITYPDMVDFYGNDQSSGSAYVGVNGRVNATVLDPHMVAALGSNIAELNYDLPQWAAPTGIGTGTTLITGRYTYLDGWTMDDAEGPLAARISDGAGQMLYTSFHNEAQGTLDMDILLREIILSL
jgi:hypothetical protein